MSEDFIEDSVEGNESEEPQAETVIQNPKLRWYVVQAFSGYEGRVQKTLLEHIEIQGLQDKFGEVLVPTEEVVEMRAGQKRKSSRKFFPGYVLVQMEMDEQSWHLVKSVPRVLGFIGGTSDRPAPITQKEADRILQRLIDTDKPKPKTLFEPGEVIRVIDGPFADFNGVVEELDYEKNRIKVSVLIFGRSTPVDLEFGQVEKGS
ncbi:transcription termination/antitermination protein NusG [Colwellia sp. MSW7]|jgi:transcriptional antiterminator NusG|uniref:Transcription termination/antitermination protein NusG n=1 Tax=Colwellia maritima TaxID=2912588 RepID=A0ABS9WYI1_9GAMM|nr:transcription termination/antitermination protein NusG [Colwellia maritima]MCI2282885.1 transcription termination/antitermination protein NusG [Colwellia maritima]